MYKIKGVRGGGSDYSSSYGNNSYSYTGSTSGEQTIASRQMVLKPASAAKKVLPGAADEDGKVKKIIIYNASLSLAVKDPDSTNKKIEKITAELGGYVQSAGSNKTVIRVKSSSMYAAMDAFGKLGKVNNKNVYADDVTDNYFDMNVRLENAEKARKRYLELLEKAQNVDEALKVEKELERLNTDIDLLKGKISKMDHLSEYSTITIYVSEKKKLGILGYVGIGVYEFVKWFFVRN